MFNRALLPFRLLVLLWRRPLVPLLPSQGRIVAVVAVPVPGGWRGGADEASRLSTSSSVCTSSRLDGLWKGFVWRRRIPHAHADFETIFLFHLGHSTSSARGVEGEPGRRLGPTKGCDEQSNCEATF